MRPERRLAGLSGKITPAFANDDYDSSIGNSNYNSFQADVRHTGKRLNFTVGYTFSKSIDQASSLSDIVNPFNFNATRALSAWDLKHSLVLTYAYQLPLERLTSRARFLTQGWSLSGITRVSSGFPVTISEEGDNSLMGSQPNGVNNHSLDLPDFTPGPLNLNSNPRNGQFYFNRQFLAPLLLRAPNVQHRSSPAPIFSDHRNKSAAISSRNFQHVQSLAVFWPGIREWRFLQPPIRGNCEGDVSPAYATRPQVHVLIL